MRILAFSDLHRDLKRARSIVERSRTADVVVGAGDYATVRRGLAEIIAVLRAIEKPTVLVCGNSETDSELRAACRGWDVAHVLHGTSLKIAGTVFFGLGGAVPITPFGAWSYDLSEQEAEALLEACPPGAVLVTHSPPKGLLDRSSSGWSLGSTAIRKTLERVRPRLVICGHIHESSGQSLEWNGIPVINAGPKGVEWELGNREA
ncbi:MAG: metallophosphoesterase family protein [Acidobacteriota bacterium]